MNCPMRPTIRIGIAPTTTPRRGALATELPKQRGAAGKRLMTALLCTRGSVCRNCHSCAYWRGHRQRVKKRESPLQSPCVCAFTIRRRPRLQRMNEIMRMRARWARLSAMSMSFGRYGSTILFQEVSCECAVPLHSAQCGSRRLAVQHLEAATHHTALPRPAALAHFGVELNADVLLIAAER